MKMHGHPEETLVCVLSRVAGRPVKWFETRQEALHIGGREQTHRFRVAFDDDGVITGLEIDIVGNVGALQALSSWGMVFVTALSFPAGYRIPNARTDFTIVATNKGVWERCARLREGSHHPVYGAHHRARGGASRAGPCRGAPAQPHPGDEFPYPTISGLRIDSGDYHGALEQMLELLDYSGWRLAPGARAC